MVEQEKTKARKGMAHSYEETAEHFGITRQAVWLIERRALAKLRKALQKEGINSTMELMPC